MATKDRRPFLRQAIRYFLAQTYGQKELIIVDDSARPAADLVPAAAPIRYLHLDAPATLGHKLNLGIEAAEGALIQKLDDDDYYHPRFLAATVGALRGADPRRTVAGCGCFLVLIAATGRLTFSGNGWFAGGTLCFARELWQQRAFRDVPRAVDWWFLKDHAPERRRLTDPELYILLRHHAGHTWTTLGRTDVTAYFSRRPPYPKPLGALVPDEDRVFYERLRGHAMLA